MERAIFPALRNKRQKVPVVRSLDSLEARNCLTTFGVAPQKHGSLNVPIEHHPTIRYMVYNGYYKVMSNISKMGHLPIPEKDGTWGERIGSWGKDGKGWEKYTNVVLKHLDSRDVPHKKHCHLKGLLRPTAFGFWINSFHKTQFIVSPPPT